MEQYEQASSYEKFGFVIIRNVLLPEEIRDIRELLLEQLAAYPERERIFTEEVFQCPEIYRLAFREKVVRMLKEVMGPELCYYSNHNVQCNQFGRWHWDSGGDPVQEFHVRPDYRFANCGIYFQENTRKWGGGIHVLPGQHKMPVSTGSFKVDYFFKRLVSRFSSKYSFPTKPVMVDIHPGDMVIFDLRLPHSATWPDDLTGLTQGRNTVLHGIPRDMTKMVLYWFASNSKMVPDFMPTLERRALEEQPGSELHYIAWLKRYFPDDFPSEFAALAKQHSIEIPTLSQKNCQEYDRIFEDKKSPPYY